MRINLVIADDHPIVLRGLANLLNTHSEFRLMAACADGETALSAVHKHSPDLLLTDLKMPGKSGLDILREVREERLTARVVILTAYGYEEEIKKAVYLGADAVFLKDGSPDLLIRCLRRVHAGEPWPERVKMNGQLKDPRGAGQADSGMPLTRRESELVGFVATGLSNREIAERLFITEGTVKLHLYHVYRKLGVRTRVKLTLYARDCGLV